MRKPRTEKQIAASRANGARSRGPKRAPTSDPDAPDYRSLARAIVRGNESRSRFNNFVDELAAFLKPASPVEYLLVGKMAAAHWRQLRLWEREKEATVPGGFMNAAPLEASTGPEETRLDRQFYRALDHFLKIHPLPPGVDPRNHTSQTTCPAPQPEANPTPEPTETQQKPTESDQNTPTPTQPDNDAPSTTNSGSASNHTPCSVSATLLLPQTPVV